MFRPTPAVPVTAGRPTATEGHRERSTRLSRRRHVNGGPHPAGRGLHKRAARSGDLLCGSETGRMDMMTRSHGRRDMVPPRYPVRMIPREPRQRLFDDTGTVLTAAARRPLGSHDVTAREHHMKQTSIRRTLRVAKSLRHSAHDKQKWRHLTPRRQTTWPGMKQNRAPNSHLHTVP